MLLLPDEQLPRQLARHLIAHDVRTVQQQGWAGLKNGELLKRAKDAGFAVFVTADRNLEFQQNLSAAGVGVIVLSAASIAIEDLLPLVAELPRKVPDAKAGTIMRVPA